MNFSPSFTRSSVRVMAAKALSLLGFALGVVGLVIWSII